MTSLLRRGALLALIAIVGAGLALLATLVWQGRHEATGHPQYVALGSSFAAGFGLGDRVDGSPIACQRGVDGYPQRLARAAGLSLVDRTCSGSTAREVVNGGPFFQRPQLAAVASTTELVTLTAGGNDVFYIGDLVTMGYRNQGGVVGHIVGWLFEAPHSPGERGVARVQSDLTVALRKIHGRAPAARIAVATYPPVLPDRGTCEALGITDEQADVMREVAAHLAAATRDAAVAGGATLVDMARIGSGHDACSAIPWTNGFSPPAGKPFHPTQAGAEATARAVARAMDLAFE